jgi:hypothetical protein
MTPSVAMAPSQQRPTRCSRDSICDAMRISGQEYDTLYTSVEVELIKRELLHQSLRTTTAKEHIRQITNVLMTQPDSPLQNSPVDHQINTITHLAARCKHNASRRKQSQRKTRLRSNDQTAIPYRGQCGRAVSDGLEPSATVGLFPSMSTILVANTAEDNHILIRTSDLLCIRRNSPKDEENISNLDYAEFIRKLEEEVGFKNSCSGIYYYVRTGRSGWTRLAISTETRWHGALQDTLDSKEHRATFVIEPLK